MPSLPLRRTNYQTGSTKRSIWPVAPKQVPQLGARWGPVVSRLRNAYEAAAKATARAARLKRKAAARPKALRRSNRQRKLSQKVTNLNNVM
ncbi:hypothetical protein FRB99_003693 [Tulasnella sp. 403]|nr:hypothetical protein FRB99_003693 [Tulasnella sp. 403]